MKTKDMSVKINTSYTDTEKWTEANDIFSSIDFSVNETVIIESYLKDGGAATSYVIGNNPQIILKGRYESDHPIIRFFFNGSALYGTMNHRKTKLWLFFDGVNYIFNATVCQAQIICGDGDNRLGVTVKLSSDGIPTMII